MSRGDEARIRRSERGFTLLELLVVVALVAAMAGLLFGGLRGNRATSLQSAQAMVSNLVTVARTRAMASGRSARLLVNVDVAGANAGERYLRYLVVQAEVTGGWTTMMDAFLPEGVYVVPGNFAAEPAGLLMDAQGGGWVRSDGVSPLRSTALRANMLAAETVNGAATEQWVSIAFGAAGTTAQSGDVVLALGRKRDAAGVGAGEAPVELGEPEAVRGVTISAYGMTALIDERASF